MAGVKDKVVTVESLGALHEHNKETYMTISNPTGIGSLSMNRLNESEIGNYSSATGYNTIASGTCSHSEGNSVNMGDGTYTYTTASGKASHAEGSGTNASGIGSHAEGQLTVASGDYSHAEGIRSVASGKASHAEGLHIEDIGLYTTASGEASHAEGIGTTASGNFSHAEGCGTVASSNYQHVQGVFNVEDADGRYLNIVGNGQKNEQEIIRSNAHTIDKQGNGWFSGDVYVGGSSQDDASKLVKTTNVVSIEYGDTLPSAGTVGRVFFKKLNT